MRVGLHQVGRHRERVVEVGKGTPLVRIHVTLADDPFAGCASLEGELDLGDTRRLHASASQLPFRDCPLLAKVRTSRRLHDWLTQNAGWYAANPNLGLPNGTVEIRD